MTSPNTRSIPRAALDGAMALGGVVALAMLTACGGPSTPPPDPRLPPAVQDPKGVTHAFAEDVPFAELSIPSDSRDGQPLTGDVPVRGLTLQDGGDDKKGYRSTTANPIKPRGLFFFRAPKGLTVQPGGVGEVPYNQRPRRASHLSFKLDRDTLTFHHPEPKVPTDLVLRYPKATERERTLHYSLAKEAGLATSEEDFVRGATVQEGWTSRQGLLLPAPGRASFDVEVPEAGVLTFTPGLSKPELADLGTSDGCTLAVTLETEGKTDTVYERTFQPGEFHEERLDLSAYAGKKVRLAFDTKPGATPLYDFCFVGEPILASRKANPRRVLMVFVDTVRPDHLSLYGYDRPTTPKLSALAKDAAVFDQARSIAPWTLPSARTVVTGRHPELYASTKTLPARLGAEGFATGMIAGNVYLTANFDMHRDWDLHTVDLFPPADVVTDQALDWLRDHEGQDSLLMVHYMTAHLPYKEPEPYKSMWAGEKPEGLRDPFILPDVRTAVRQGLDADGKQYIADRYDQTLRWLDDEVSRLIDGLDDDDIVVFFSDHGEELWDHGGFEHGHTLFDELLRVPLFIRAPGMKAGHVDTPVSLLDVTPTVLDLLDVPTDDDLDGTSLVKLAAGDPTLTRLLAERPQTFGRPLYGRDRWGVLSGDTKWTTHAGNEAVFDLGDDPGEATTLKMDETGLAPLRATAGEGLGSKGGVSYRLLPSNGGTSKREIEVTITVPGGIAAVWKGGDPHQKTPVTIERLSEDSAKIVWHKGNGGREVYVLPERPVSEVTHEVTGTWRSGMPEAKPWDLSKVPSSPAESRRRLTQLAVPEGAVTVYWGMAPAPPAGSAELDATDDESTDALEALGYKERDPEQPAP